jgi:hypothetical protein
MINLCYFGNTEGSVLIHTPVEELRPSRLFFLFHLDFDLVQCCALRISNEVQSDTEWNAETAYDERVQNTPASQSECHAFESGP